MFKLVSKIPLFILPLTLACTVDTASQSWAVEDTEGGTQGCPRWQCGTNGPEVNGMPIGEIDLAGGENSDGYRLLSVTDALGLPLTLSVRNGEFRGTTLLGNTRTGAAMIGTRILLEDLGSLAVHALVIDDYDQISSWTSPGFTVPAYHLLAVDVDPLDLSLLGPSEEVCGDSGVANGLFSAHYAVLVKGERYDPYTKTVSATGAAASSWFNIACNGSALSKMKLMGYDPEFVTNGVTKATTTAQRTATLKMITAAYCPSGRSFTESGHALRWQNRDGSVTPYNNVPPEASPEAIWTEDGALCLDVPRLEAEHPGIGAAIEAECGAPIPSCEGLHSQWQSHGEWRTANPTNES